MEVVSNVGENMVEVGVNVVENMVEGVEKGVEMVKDVVENVVECVEDVIDDGLFNLLLLIDRGDIVDRVNMRIRDDKDSRSWEIGVVWLSGDFGEDLNGDGNSDSEEEGFIVFNCVGVRSRNNERWDFNLGEDLNGDGDSDSEEWRDGFYVRW